jgi:hypothetical protein
MIRESSATRTPWHKNKENEVGFRQKERNLSLKKIIAAVSAVDKIV